jgi:hypothetical protein
MVLQYDAALWCDRFRLPCDLASFPRRMELSAALLQYARTCKYDQSGHINTNELDSACSLHGRDEKCLVRTFCEVFHDKISTIYIDHCLHTM